MAVRNLTQVLDEAALFLSPYRRPLLFVDFDPLLLGCCRRGVAGLHILGLLHCRLELLRSHQRHDLRFGKVTCGSQNKGKPLRADVVRKFINGNMPNGNGLTTTQLATGKLIWMLATIQMSGTSI
jgi:hypothetical protein